MKLKIIYSIFQPCLCDWFELGRIKKAQRLAGLSVLAGGTFKNVSLRQPSSQDFAVWSLKSGLRCRSAFFDPTWRYE